MLGRWQGWHVCGGTVLVATTGNVLGVAISARWAGVSRHESRALGALMNTRGLMELVALNITYYGMGIIAPTLFAMMVVMALATTFMTCPLPALPRPSLPPHSYGETKRTPGFLSRVRF
ncbi:hypothetical protein [Paludibacterium paludis]|uniref:hypothetical protein n=1 Tax=Paludibacterium paludis TaxID=1225769 RepID=UPI003CC83923